MLLVVPADPLAPRRPDPHFAPEAAAARDAGLTGAVVDHDALERDEAADAVRRVPPDDDVVYRGWMLTAAQYAAFEHALAGRGATLRTSAAQYRQAHELPATRVARRLHELRDDSAWRLVELGDGQVSDRPSSCPAADLVAALG